VLAAEATSRLNQHVVMQGHAQTIRKLGNLVFVILRDRSGTIQLVIDDPQLIQKLSTLAPESTLTAAGTVTLHPSNQRGVELRVVQVDILSAATDTLPVEIHKPSKLDSLSTSSMFDYRPLTLRSEKARSIFRIEAAICQGFRNFLQNVLLCITIHYRKVMGVKASFDDNNLRKNGVDRSEILQVFESDLTIAFDLEPSGRGNDRAMIVGWTYAGRVLEIGIEYFEDDEREHIFHAMDAGKEYKREFRRRLGNGG